MRWTAVIIAVLFVGVVLSFENATAKEYTFEFQRIVDVSGPTTLDLSYIQGKVKINGAETDRIVIDAIKRVRASNMDEAQEVADHIEIKVSTRQSTVVVNTNYLRLVNRTRSFWQKVLGVGEDSFGDVDYVITVPTECNLIIDGHTGKLEISDTRGDIRISTMSAHVLLSSIDGKMEISNSSGSTRGEFLFGPITVRQAVGDIDLQWVEGDIKINATSGKINIRQVRGAIDLVTKSGEVTIQTELDSPRNYFVETLTGKIRFDIPESASGLLEIRTESGEISSEIPIAVKTASGNRLVGEFGLGGPIIKLFSSSGDVEIAIF